MAFGEREMLDKIMAAIQWMSSDEMAQITTSALDSVQRRIILCHGGQFYVLCQSVDNSSTVQVNLR